MVEPRVEVIEGRRTLVVQRTPPLPADLSTLLDQLRVIRRMPLRLGGARSACMDQEHRFADWLEGFHLGTDNRTRQLRLLACQDCGGVSVRDVSFDTLPVRPGRHAPRRRDHQLGWYSGARPNQRQYT